MFFKALLPHINKILNDFFNFFMLFTFPKIPEISDSWNVFKKRKLSKKCFCLLRRLLRNRFTNEFCDIEDFL